MWVVLVAAAAGGVTREVLAPFYDGGVAAVTQWVVYLIPGWLLTYVLVGRWKKGLTTLWQPSWPEARRLLIGAPLGLLAIRLLFENHPRWLWLVVGITAVELTLAIVGAVCAVRYRRRRTDAYGIVAADPYA